MAKHERVLLKRGWRTPVGRFDQSHSGVPTLIPRSVLERFPLPSDAEIVGSDYVPPAEREDAAAMPSDMTQAQMEAEIQRRVDAKIAEDEARRRGERNQETADRADAAAKNSAPAPAHADADDGDDILDGSVSDVVEYIDSEYLTREQLDDLLAREQGGKTRKGVVVALEAAIADLEDEYNDEDDHEETD